MTLTRCEGKYVAVYIHTQLAQPERFARTHPRALVAGPRRLRCCMLPGHSCPSGVRLACAVEDGEAKTSGFSTVPQVSLTSVPQSGLRPRPAYSAPSAPGHTPHHLPRVPGVTACRGPEPLQTACPGAGSSKKACFLPEAGSSQHA